MPQLNVSINGSKARSGANKVTSALSSIKTSALSLVKSALSPLNVAIGAIGGGFAVGGLIKIADQYTSLNSQLKFVTGSSQEAAWAQESLFKMSQQTGTSMISNAKALVKLSSAQDTMGTSTSENIEILSGLNILMRNTGVDAQQSSAAMLQLTQALGSGKLAGDEFRSIYENAPALMRQFASSIGIPVGELKALASTGELTTEVMTKALLELSQSADNTFEDLPKTVESGWQRVKNSFENVWVAIGSETGIMSWIFEGLIRLSEIIILNKDNFVSWAITVKSYVVSMWAEVKPIFISIWDSLANIGQQFASEGVTIASVFTLIGTGVIYAAKGVEAMAWAIGKLITYWTFMKWLVTNFHPIAIAARAVSSLMNGGSISDAASNAIDFDPYEKESKKSSSGNVEITNNYNQNMSKSQIDDITTKQSRNMGRL